MMNYTSGICSFGELKSVATYSSSGIKVFAETEPTDGNIQSQGIGGIVQNQLYSGPCADGINPGQKILSQDTQGSPGSDNYWAKNVFTDTVPETSGTQVFNWLQKIFVKLFPKISPRVL